MKENLAIFDLDGTLFDTKEVNYYSYKKALEDIDVVLNKDFFFERCNGRHYMEFLPGLVNNDKHVEEVHEKKKIYYVSNLDKSKENKHLFKFIKSIVDSYNISIVTTATKKNTIDILSYYSYETLFDYIVTQECVSRPKPDPQGFLMAMKHFDISPEKTIIFEDSDVGLEAAIKTGATVMAVKRF